MTASDQLKVLNAGFRIIRAEAHRRQIKTKTKSSHSWSILEKGFESKAAVERRMRELLEDKMTIED